MQNDNMLIKQTTCLICRNVLDFFSESEVLVQCKSCKTIYHEACWKVISSCSSCHNSEIDIVDKTFFVNEFFEDTPQDGES